MNISSVETSYGQVTATKSNGSNSSKIASLEKQREALVSQKQEIASSDSEDKDTQVQLIDSQIQLIDSQITQLKSQETNNSKGEATNKVDTRTIKNNGDEVKGGVVISGSLKELIEKYKTEKEEE